MAICVTIDEVRECAHQTKVWLDTAPSNNIYRQRYDELWRWCTNTILQYETAEKDRKARRTDTLIRVTGTGLMMLGGVVLSNSTLGASWISSTKGPTSGFLGKLL